MPRRLMERVEVGGGGHGSEGDEGRSVRASDSLIPALAITWWIWPDGERRRAAEKASESDGKEDTSARTKW